MKTAVLFAVALAIGAVAGWLYRGRIAEAEIAAANSAVRVAAPGVSAADRAAIERLHEADVAATLSQDPDQLEGLWDANAVRLEAGSPAEIGRQTIHADDGKERADNPAARTLSYTPRIHDLEIADGWASEWDTFDASFRLSPKGKVQRIRGKALRVLRRQTDGSWKFIRVMVVLDTPLPGRPVRR